MKPSFFLPASLALNLALAGVAGYLLGARQAAAPAINSASPAQALAPAAWPSAPPTAANGNETAPSATLPPSPAVVPSFQPVANAVPSVNLSQSAPPALAIPPQRIFPRPSSISSQAVSASGTRAIARNASPHPAYAPASDVPPTNGQPVNTAAPGNSLNFHGVRVAVAEAYQGGEAGAALGVDMTPSISAPEADGKTRAATENNASGSSDSSSNTTTSSNSAASGGGTSSSSTAGSQAAAPADAAVIKSGSSDFTQEDELFRMKWGWAAFDAARTEAIREAERQKLAI